MWFGFRRLVCGLLALTACLFACWFFRATNTVQLSSISGERVFYLSSASSNARVKNNLSLLDVFRVKGESVRVTGVDGESVARDVLKRYDASVYFSESVAGVRSYYCYSPRLKGGIVVNGVKVNLHVAVDGDACVVGSPVIFGGF